MSRDDDLLEPTPLSEDPSIPQGLAQLFRDARVHPGLPSSAIERAIRGAQAAGAKGASGVGSSGGMLAIKIVMVLVLCAGLGVGVFLARAPEPAQEPPVESFEPPAELSAPVIELVEPAPPQEPVATSPDEAPSSLRVRSQPRHRASRPEATSSEPNDREPTEHRASEPPSSEAAMLLRARRILVSDPGAVLEITAEHSSRYPTGDFVEERETLAIEALTRLGRESEARTRARRFEANHPSSPYLDRIRRALGDF